MRTRYVVLALGALMLPFAAGAAELEFNPGLWETTMTRTNPLTGEPTTETSEECIKQTSFKPSDMMKEAQGCELLKDELNGNTLSFVMECSMQGNAATIDGEVQTDGQTGKGNMNMQMSMGEMKMNMEMDWTSRRLGDC